MHIDVLGTLRATVGDTSVLPTALKQRRLLILLALSGGDMVTMANVVDELWDGRPPRSSVTAVQTYVLALRTLIATAGEDPKRALITRSGGYQLDLSGGRLDAQEYEHTVALGHRLLRMGDFAGASVAFRTSHDMWRGAPLADLAPGPRLAVEVVRLEEMRLSALESRVEADLGLGRHRELLSELSSLTARYPLHEHFHAQYMLALYRSGRRGQALGAYHRVREALQQELGIEPSPRLWRLQRDVLAAV